MKPRPRLSSLRVPKYDLALEKKSYDSHQQTIDQSTQRSPDLQTTVCFVAKHNDLHNLSTLNAVSRLLETPQTSPFSLIIVCYSDQFTTIRLIEKWINQSDRNWKTLRFFVISERCPTSMARNIAIEQAHTSYLLFLDGGDFVYPSYLTKCVSILNSSSDVAIVYSLTQLVSDDTDKILLGNIPWSTTSIRQDNRVTPVGLCRRSSLLNVGGYSIVQNFSEPFPEEKELWLRLAEQGYQGIRLPELLARCIQTSSQCYLFETSSQGVEGRIETIQSNYVIGWAIGPHQFSNSILVRLRIDGKDTDSTQLAYLELPNLDILIDGQLVACGFKLRIPDNFLDGDSHFYEVLNDEQQVIDQVHDHRFSIRKNIDMLTSNRIVGWITDSNQKLPIELDLYIDNHKVKSLTSDVYRQDIEGGKKCGFDIHLEKSFISYRTVDLTLKDSRYSVLGTPQYLIPPNGTISTFQKVSQLIVKDNQCRLGDIEKEWLINHFFPSLIQESQRSLRSGVKTVDFMFSLAQEISSTKTNSDDLDNNHIVDVIIPVYKNLNITQCCVEAALSAQNKTAAQFIIINDDSPDASIHDYLNSIKSNERITLITNSENQGFVRSVNTGITLSNHHDVILLNSDAIVNDYWIDRLNDAAYQSPDIASATPLSNHASIFSYPRICEEVETLPSDISGPLLSQLAYQQHHNRVVDVPTMHGFCCFIKRQAIAHIGFFDAVKWGKGYGEEVDWSQKAAARGWRHVAVPGIFIEHRGSQSFTKSKRDALKKALSKLAWEYPEFDHTVQDFIHRDPLAKYRRRLDIERLKRVSSGYILFVSHNLGGGTQRHIEELSQHLLKEGVRVVLLCPSEDHWIVLSSITPKMVNLGIVALKIPPLDIEAKYQEDNPDELSALLDDLRDINVFHIHIHGVLDFQASDFIWELAYHLDIEYDVTLHDYYTICPRVNLVNEEGTYCGEPESAQCNQCIVQNGTYKNSNLQHLYENLGSIEIWRKTFYQRLHKARKVYVPSGDARNRITRYFPLRNIFLKPHPDLYPNANSQDLSIQKMSQSQLDKPSLLRDDLGPCAIAIIGAISRIKGCHLLYDTACYALKNSMPLKFIIFGHTEEDNRFESLPNVTITGRYSTYDELIQLMQDYPCDAAAFLSHWPETYCYTLSEALRLGLPPLAPKIGAFTERLDPINVRTLLPLDQLTPDNLATELVNLAQYHRSTHQYLEGLYDNVYDSFLQDYYGFRESHVKIAQPCN